MKYLLLLLFFLPSTVYAQSITVNQTTPCFLNYTAGTELWDNCGMDEDWLRGSMLGWEYITGGYFSMIFAGILILATYLKYHKAIYPIIIGLSMLPVSYYLFPSQFQNFVIIMIVATVAILIYKIYKNQTSEF